MSDFPADNNQIILLSHHMSPENQQRCSIEMEINHVQEAISWLLNTSKQHSWQNIGYISSLVYWSAANILPVKMYVETKEFLWLYLGLFSLSATFVSFYYVIPRCIKYSKKFREEIAEEIQINQEKLSALKSELQRIKSLSWENDEPCSISYIKDQIKT